MRPRVPNFFWATSRPPVFRLSNLVSGANGGEGGEGRAKRLPLHIVCGHFCAHALESTHYAL